MSIYDHSINRLDGSPLDLHDYEDKAVLIVNVASKCGLTPQYEGLERLHEAYTDRGFSVVGCQGSGLGLRSGGGRFAGSAHHADHPPST